MFAQDRRSPPPFGTGATRRQSVAPISRLAIPRLRVGIVLRHAGAIREHEASPTFTPILLASQAERGPALAAAYNTFNGPNATSNPKHASRLRRGSG
jgi:hypothetical protein